jgi:hypothetical protein
VARRRPIGGVRLDRAFWDEIRHAITAYGGSLTGFLLDLSKRLFARAPGDLPDPLWPAAPPRSPILITHPP